MDAIECANAMHEMRDENALWKWRMYIELIGMRRRCGRGWTERDDGCLRKSDRRVDWMRRDE